MAPNPIKSPTQELEAGDDFERRNRFQEPLNDTTGRPRRIFRKTPPPPSTNRDQSTSKIHSAPPSQDAICASARRSRFEEPLNDTTGRPTRVFRKTPPPRRSKDSESGVPPCEGTKSKQPAPDFSALLCSADLEPTPATGFEHTPTLPGDSPCSK